MLTDNTYYKKYVQVYNLKKVQKVVFCEHLVAY